jgi:hypothetical protein
MLFKFAVNIYLPAGLANYSRNKETGFSYDEIKNIHGNPFFCSFRVLAGV